MPTVVPTARSTIGWNAIEMPSPSTNRWISARRASSRSRSSSSRRSCFVSSDTMPAMTSVDRLAPPAITFWIEPTISSPAVPLTR